MSFFLQFRGELAALTAAFIWACGSIVYTGVGRQITPLALNFTKGWIAIALLCLTFLLTGQSIPSIEFTPLLMLFLSGVVGIGFGDTAYFNALNCMGARRTLLFETLAPPLSAILALIFLHERLAISAWLGIGLTIAGVMWVILEQTSDQHENFRPRLGILYGLLAAIGQAVGAVMSRSALVNTEIDSLWSTLIRLMGGTIALFIWILLKRQSTEVIKPLRDPRLLTIITGTAFISTYLGIWLQQTSLKYATTGIAQALSSTSPLFVIPLSRAMGDRVSMRSVIGVLISLVGVSLLFHRQ
ncbi:DMT family transporter [Leptolyngbya sp. NIES-2104]|uniref:DMT family transporter n=1 Tax=Leptolyngbya sp. NIES-2104 TaxID=1552121 RepID=UPI0006EC79B8|nr:DMT family transporter [Leptolyngbya sp. NIES-2104]GAP96167.1 integral membrane protein [Leptolyngbya sp. NIES-2104]